MKKNILSKLMVVVLLLTLFATLFCFVACDKPEESTPPQRYYFLGNAKNVIIMIGDGMGPNHLEATKAYYGVDSLNMETMSTFVGEQTTRSRDEEITDSAAAATALSCGQKTDNGYVARVDKENLENMSEFASGKGMDVGIIATEKITGATPSGFSSHSYSRSNDTNLFNGHVTSEVDIFITQYDETLYNEKRVAAIGENGFEYITTLAELTENKYSSAKIFATVPSFDPYGTDKENCPTLAQASLYAINYLDQKSDNGFFMMIEGSHIDKESHSNDFLGMVGELRAFDEAVKAVLEWAAQDGETLVIVTADHETGGLEYDAGTHSNSEFAPYKFTSDDHTADNVFFFTYNFSAEDVKYLTEDGSKSAVIDNTTICHIMRDYITNYRKAK